MGSDLSSQAFCRMRTLLCCSSLKSAFLSQSSREMTCLGRGLCIGLSVVIRRTSARTTFGGTGCSTLSFILTTAHTHALLSTARSIVLSTHKARGRGKYIRHDNTCLYTNDFLHRMKRTARYWPTLRIWVHLRMFVLAP